MLTDKNISQADDLLAILEAAEVANDIETRPLSEIEEQLQMLGIDANISAKLDALLENHRVVSPARKLVDSLYIEEEMQELEQLPLAKVTSQLDFLDIDHATGTDQLCELIGLIQPPIAAAASPAQAASEQKQPGGAAFWPSVARELRAPSLGAFSLVIAFGATIAGYEITNSTFPRTIPLQAGLQKPLMPIETEGTAGVGKEQVTAELNGGVYKIPGRELTINVKVKNGTSQPVRLGEYTAAGLRFLNPDVFKTKPDYPDYLLADRGLSTDTTPIAPGESKEIVVKIRDARWDIERLSDLAYDTDSQIGGLLFFVSPDGKRYAAEIGGPVIPKFVSGDMP